MTVRIAELHPNDLPALRALYFKVRRATFTWFDTSHYQLSAFDSDTVDEYTLVAHLGDTIVGFISAYLPDNFIHHLYVDDKYQKQGIGTALLQAMLEKLEPPVRLKCLQNNTNAVAFYKRNGFRHIKRGVSVEGVYILFEYGEMVISKNFKMVASKSLK